ncbi:MAG: flagellar biosynthetic protein FliR, partial [Agathobacter sp.]|nr:flagellar biosynthetic protein FliR [Agathobacter sp.]
NCILGVMAKVAPQMNMFSIGIQLKIIVGFVVLFLTIFLFPSVSDMVFDEIKKMVVLFVEGMY